MIHIEKPANSKSIAGEEKKEYSLKKASLFSPIEEMIERVKNEPEDIFLTPGVKEGGFGFGYGPAKSGKTTYLETLFWHIAAGKTEFMGSPLNCTNRRCLFVSLEEGGKKHRFQRSTKQSAALTEQEREYIRTNKNYLVNNDEMLTQINSEKDWQELEKLISESEASNVVIDSLNRLTSDSNADEVVAKRVSSRLQELVAKFPITLIVINHTTKQSSQGIQSEATMSGSRIYGSDADFLLAINRTDSNARYAKIARSRYGRDDYDTVDQFDITDNQMVRFIGKVTEQSLFTQLDKRYDDSNADLLLSEIETICRKKGSEEFVPSELAYLCNGANKRFSKPTLFTNLKKLQSGKKIVQIENGPYKIL